MKVDVKYDIIVIKYLHSSTSLYMVGLFLNTCMLSSVIFCKKNRF